MNARNEFINGYADDLQRIRERLHGGAWVDLQLMNPMDNIQREWQGIFANLDDAITRLRRLVTP